jgi:hypothetical protein
MGPIALFDKSFLQSISIDESVWFDRFFIPMVCPIFYVETLGDLAKEPTSRSSEDIVRDIANKFPEWAGSPCCFHGELAIHDLLGNQVSLQYQIPRPGGRYVKSCVVFEATAEEQAFSRWQKGKFHEVERVAAAAWRETLSELDLVAVGREMRRLGFTQKACKTLQDAKAIAEALVSGVNDPYALLALAIQFLHVPQHLHEPISRAWQSSGKRTLPEFAPYAAHVLSVEVFFQVALGAGLIGGERPSNRTDIAYLFYLPFCMVFVSSDKLHRNTAQLFMRNDQEFVWGIDLKPALRAINEHFLQLPEQEREQGISAFGHVPPDGNLVTDLWDRFMGKGFRQEKPVEATPEGKAQLLKRLQEFTTQPALGQGEVIAERGLKMMSVKRSVRMKRGSWWQLPKNYKEQAGDE